MLLDAQLPTHRAHDTLNWLRFGQSQQKTVEVHIKIPSKGIAVKLKPWLSMHRNLRLWRQPGGGYRGADTLSMMHADTLSTMHERPHLSNWSEDWVLHFLGQAIDHSAATRPQQGYNCSFGCYMRLSSKRVYCLLEIQRRHQTCTNQARACHMHGQKSNETQSRPYQPENLAQCIMHDFSPSINNVQMHSM